MSEISSVSDVKIFVFVVCYTWIGKSLLKWPGDYHHSSSVVVQPQCLSHSSISIKAWSFTTVDMEYRLVGVQVSFLKMILSSILLSALAVSRSCGLPLSENEYVVHEHLGALHPRWQVNSVIARDMNPQIEMRIAITQQNVHRGEEFLMEVSDPASSLFGQHWSKEQIAKTFSPSEASIEAVKSWLVASGIDKDQIVPSRDGGWLIFPIGLSSAEDLLQAKYRVYTDSQTGDSQLACDSYSVPQSIRSHIDFITPTVHLMTRKSKQARSFPKSHDMSLQPVKTSNLATSDSRLKGKDLTVCDTLTTPDCLRALYKMPEGKTANPKNTYGILELSPETYSQTGLDVFFRNFTKELVGRPPSLESIDGGSRPPPGPPSILKVGSGSKVISISHTRCPWSTRKTSHSTRLATISSVDPSNCFLMQ